MSFETLVAFGFLAAAKSGIPLYAWAVILLMIILFVLAVAALIIVADKTGLEDNDK